MWKIFFTVNFHHKQIARLARFVNEDLFIFCMALVKREAFRALFSTCKVNIRDYPLVISFTGKTKRLNVKGRLRPPLSALSKKKKEQEKTQKHKSRADCSSTVLEPFKRILHASAALCCPGLFPCTEKKKSCHEYYSTTNND